MMDETQIRRTIEFLKPAGKLFEIRLIDGKYNASGYFTNADVLIHELKRVGNRKNLNVYITLNGIKDECYARAQRDKLVAYAAPTTSDSDIKLYEWLMVDVDPKRAAGTSSSDLQVGQAKQKANEIFYFMRGRGWSDPVVAMSGNGVHLLYPVGLKNEPDNVKLMQNCLMALSMIFSDEQVDIDLKTFNPARICKLYGTMAQKGSHTPQRPHRMSKMIRAGGVIQNDKSLLQSLADLLPKEEKPQKYNQFNPRTFDLESWIDTHGLRVQKSGWNGGSKWTFEECPFDASHKGKDAAIIQTPDGKICFNCFHNSCAGNKWRELRQKYEPDAYDKKYIAPNRYPNCQNPNYQVVRVKETKRADGEPIFYTTEQIRLLEEPPEEFIKTGVNGIDVKMRGLKKGFATCISGLRGCGKSSFISQLAIEAANQDYRTALFSGELKAKHLYQWLMLQAAGQYNVRPTQYDHFFTVKPNIEAEISKWLNERIFVYNNHYGNNFAEIYQRLNECVSAHRVDLVILDNLMALNITMLEQEKYQQQSMFVQMLEDFAKTANIHIVFVAHPRKSMGFLRLDDVSGSNDIVNRVDNAFVLHRVNEDFKRLSKQMFKWADTNPLYSCNNVIEICKDRASGIQDEFIPLYFEKSCKRLKNTQWESKVYAWDEIAMKMHPEIPHA